MTSPSEPIPIALVITELNVGGAERCLVNIACGLNRERFAPRVYSIAPPPTKQTDLVDRLHAASVPAHFAEAASIWRFRSALRTLKSQLAQQTPRLVQSFLFHANIMASWAVGNAVSPRLVAGIRVADPRRWRLALERRALLNAARIVCVSDSVADFARETAGFARERLAVIRNGIDPDPYVDAEPADLRPLGIQASDPVLLFVGRIEKQKGVDWLMRDAPELLRQLPQHHLVFAGDGPLRETLATRAAAASLTRRIHFPGWRRDIPELLRRAQLLILPSRWEGMPNVLLEAMASGCPLVATRGEGVLELLGDAANSQTVEFGDAQGFIASILRLVNDQPEARRLATSHQKRVRERFSISRMVRRYESLYLSVLDD